MKILAIESSCDETAASVVENGSKVLSNIISSQIAFHQKYGGIVPEVASRMHIEVIAAVVKQALAEAKTSFKKIDAVAATYGPGLVGSLIVGLNYAKALAYALDVPFIPVNHIEGHIYANFIGGNSKSEVRNPKFPFVCLVVSGGHTNLYYIKGHGKYELLGRTRDDAAGEAFDKVARFLGIGYPGGPIIDKMAKTGDESSIDFPRAMINDGYDFSFSGLKTAVVNYVMRYSSGSGESSGVKRTRNTQHKTIHQTHPIDAKRIPDIVASFQQAAVDILVEKTIRAAKAKKVKWVAMAGGVSANSRLREEMARRAAEEGLNLSIPEFKYCTDNAAMIGSVAYYLRGKVKKSSLDTEVVSTLRM
jgi:N6-L-threonylcarbamoyladenine synthase